MANVNPGEMVVAEARVIVEGMERREVKCGSVFR